VLARVNRIVQGDDLRRVSRKGAKFRSPLVIGSWLISESDAPARFGFIVSKQVGGAVARNTVKRRLRALAAQTLSAHPRGYDVVVRAQPGSSAASFEMLAHEWKQLVAHLMESR